VDSVRGDIHGPGGMRVGVVAAALALVALAAAPARAAYPGENGLIAYVSSHSGPPTTTVVDPDGGVPRAVGRPGQVSPAWSPDGAALAVAGAISRSPRGPATFEIFTMHLNGEPTAITADRGQDFDPAWSPDGMRIAYSAMTGDNRDIWVVNATGGNAQRLTRNSADEGTPSWSPDGTQIAFTRARGADNVIVVMSPDGSHVRTLRTGPGDDEDPDWSPDGTRIAYAQYAPGSSTADIWTMNAIGGDARPLIHTRANETQPAWSPDGRQIAFTSNRNKHDDVWVMPVGGGRATDVTPDPASDDSPAWGPRSDVGNLEAVPGMQRASRSPGLSL
jgi:Tol biopolymer transport system component